MTKNHLKRISSPKTWGIKRKEAVFVTRPNPGAYKMDQGLSINAVLRDLMGVSKNTKETKNFLNQGDVLVDGNKVQDHRFTTGLMSVISFPKTKENFRMLFSKGGKLVLIPISEAESNIKLCKVTGKKILGKDKIQINLFDGRNILVKKDDYKVGDSLVIELPSQKIKEFFKFEKKATIFLISGKHIGESGIVEDIKGSKVLYKRSSGEVFQTKKDYAFVIGKEKPAISLGETTK